MEIYALEMGQDDPSKCTARKMVRLEFAKVVSSKYHASDTTIVLNPFAHRVLSPTDRYAKGLLVVDCSWNKVREVFFRRIGGKHRRLPLLLAANPINYARLGMLSSLEAVAAGLYIIGEQDRARGLLRLYKWGETFVSLNKEPLDSYSNASSESEILRLEREFFPQMFIEKD